MVIDSTAPVRACSRFTKSLCSQFPKELQYAAGMRQSFALVLLLALTALASAATTQAPPLPSPQSPIKETPTVLGTPTLQIPITATPEGTSGLTADQETILTGVYFPTSVAFDSAGNLYITEGYSARVRKVTPAGTITFVAGTGTPGFGGDGGPATSAQLQNPFDIAVDTGDNLFIADAGNSRIRKISANGVISTVAGSGTPGFSGDDGPAVRAQLNNPGASHSIPKAIFIFPIQEMRESAR